MDLESGSYVQFGPFRLYSADKLLYRDRQLVRLPPKVVDTLMILVAHHGHVVPKKVLVERLWPDTFVEEGALAQSISLLRKALGEYGAWIENYPRRHYCPNVSRIDSTV
jgi:DNA-binding winged helix-turn-helix (wHTH) protein